MKTWPGYEESIIHSMLSDSDTKDEKSHVEHGLIEHHEEHDLMEYHGEHKKLIKHQDQHTEIIKHEEN